MALSRVEDYLVRNNVDFNRIVHGRAFSAQRSASVAHVSGCDVAKTVILKADNQFIMAIVPANVMIDFGKLQYQLGVDILRLATESEFTTLFDDCEVGALPPFGNLYHLEVYISDQLAHSSAIAFNSGKHTELIQISYADFHRLVRPKVLRFGWEHKKYEA